MNKSSKEFKADAGKSNPLLLYLGLPRALTAANRVLDYGAQKYEAHSWQSVAVERCAAAARRHQRARDLGELADDESGLLHLAHEATNILFQLEMKCRDAGLDWYNFNKSPQDHKT